MFAATSVFAESLEIASPIVIPHARVNLKLKALLAAGQQDTPELRRAISDGYGKPSTNGQTNCCA